MSAELRSCSTPREMARPCAGSSSTGSRSRCTSPPPRARPTRLLFATGVPTHTAELQRIAGKQCLRLAPSSLSRRGQAGYLSLENEAAVYEEIGLPFIPPELREGAGEIEAART